MEDDNLVLDSPLETSGKYRMKWTPELHNSFEEAVNQLGGPDRATPKGIFKAMSLPGLTIAHVKSHLQKYRMSNFVLETSDRGKPESRTISEILPNFYAASRFQMKEALQMHLKEQNRMQDQMEAQRCLKIKIELQGRYLEKIVEDYRDSSYSNCKSSWPLPTALPSLVELSESHSTKCGSDSEDISQSIHWIPYRQEKLHFGDVKRQITAGHEMSQLGFSLDESHGSSMSNSSPTVSHPFKRSRVGKDVSQPSLGVHL